MEEIPYLTLPLLIEDLFELKLVRPWPIRRLPPPGSNVWVAYQAPEPDEEVASIGDYPMVEEVEFTEARIPYTGGQQSVMLINIQLSKTEPEVEFRDLDGLRDFIQSLRQAGWMLRAAWNLAEDPEHASLLDEFHQDVAEFAHNLEIV